VNDAAIGSGIGYALGRSGDIIRKSNNHALEAAGLLGGLATGTTLGVIARHLNKRTSNQSKTNR